MMDIFYPYALHALIVSNAILLLGAAIAMLRFVRLVRRDRSFWDSPTGAQVQAKRDPDAALAGSLAGQLATLREQIDELAKQKVAQPTELPFEHAARMVRHGASVADLTRTCGLNKAEAMLMWRLHAQQRKASAASAH